MEDRNIKLRHATSHDLKTITDIYERTILYQDQTVRYNTWRLGQYPTKEYAKMHLKKDSLFVLEDDTGMLGTVILNEHQDPAYEYGNWSPEDFEPEEVLVIHTLAIDPQKRKQGYGGKLIDLIIAYAMDKKYKSIRLDTSIINKPAMHLYESKGFQQTGTSTLYFDYKPPAEVALYELVLNATD